MPTRALPALAALVAASMAARADGVAPFPQMHESDSLAAFAAEHADCREWTDECAVCARTDDGKFRCSLPGIACEPAALSCRTPASTDLPSPPAPYSAPNPSVD